MPQKTRLATRLLTGALDLPTTRAELSLDATLLDQDVAKHARIYIMDANFTPPHSAFSRVSGQNGEPFSCLDVMCDWAEHTRRGQCLQ